MKKSARSVSVYILRTQQKCMNLFSSRQAPSAIIGNRHYWKKKLNEVRKGQKGPKGQKYIVFRGTVWQVIGIVMGA